MPQPVVEYFKLYSTGILGTAVRVVVLLNIDTADAAKITIEDPTETDIVDEQDMTKLTNGIYEYIYQTAETLEDGEFLITVKITSGSYTSVDQKTFKMVDQDEIIDL